MLRKYGEKFDKFASKENLQGGNGTGVNDRNDQRPQAQNSVAETVSQMHKGNGFAS